MSERQTCTAQSCQGFFSWRKLTKPPMLFVVLCMSWFVSLLIWLLPKHLKRFFILKELDYSLQNCNITLKAPFQSIPRHKRGNCSSWGMTSMWWQNLAFAESMPLWGQTPLFVDWEALGRTGIMRLNHSKARYSCTAAFSRLFHLHPAMRYPPSQQALPGASSVKS